MADTIQEHFAGKTILVTLRRPNAEVISLIGDRFTGAYEGTDDFGIYLRRQERVMLIHWNAVETVEEAPRLPESE
jgi:sRNA-binding regulator protein Hfq